MQKKIKRQLPSTMNLESGSSANSGTPQGCPTAKLYTTTTLTLERFIKIFCGGDLTWLTIEGDPTLGELVKAWDAIQSDFNEAMKDKEGAYKIKLLSQINKLQFDYELIHLCINFLQVAYDKEVVDILRKHTLIMTDFNPEDQEQYFHNLQILINRSQKLLLDIDNKKAELAVLDKEDNQKIEPKQFDRLVAQVSIYAKFHINKKEVTLSEFLEYYSSMRTHYQELQKDAR